MFERQLDKATTSVRKGFKHLGLPAPDEITWVPTPFSGQWGFGTAACFQVAAAEARSGKKVKVPARAEEISGLLQGEIGVPEGFERVEAAGGYLNLYVEAAIYAGTVVDTVLDQGPDFGRGAQKTERLMVEYAQPNTHHSFHIGHARNAILGESLARIVEFAGFDTIRASYPGDHGLGVIKCMWAYKSFFEGQEPEGVHERGQWLLTVYAKANSLLGLDEDEEDEELQSSGPSQYETEVRVMYRKWDEGDPEVRELWKRTRQWSLDELEDILKMLDIEIDVFFYESEVDEPAKAIAEELIQLGLAEDERPEGGPVIIKIDEKLGLKSEKYRTAVLLRNDGTTLYLAKDLALAKAKFEKYQVDRSVYVVDVRQSFHFVQAFKILELWGFPQAANCYHLAYGFVTLPEGAMSARRGNVILFKDVVDETFKRVVEIVEEKNPDLSPEQRDEAARQVSMGALAYTMLAVDNRKDTIYDWDRALDFEGQAAPYIQYAHVRANSILRRAGKLPKPLAIDHELAPAEIQLLDRLSRFPLEAQRAADEYKPLLIANYAYDLARDFAEFYQHCPVLKAEGAVRDARLRLTAAAKQVLATSLRLLTIQAPEVM
jgi:arginyl-tRNA synthetase